MEEEKGKKQGMSYIDFHIDDIDIQVCPWKFAAQIGRHMPDMTYTY